MKHSALNRGLMMDWIKTSIDDDAAMPTDSEIMDRFDFGSPELARTLLADLADAGKIRITGSGDTRTIMLPGDASPHRLQTVRPEPTIVRADPQIEATTQRIMQIVARGKGPAQPAAPPAAIEPKRGYGPSRQINIKADDAVFAVIAARAARDGVSMTAAAKSVMTDAIFSPGVVRPEPVCKPLVTAPLIRAASRDGMELYAFVAMILARGFASYEADAAMERAA